MRTRANAKRQRAVTSISHKSTVTLLNGDVLTDIQEARGRGYWVGNIVTLGSPQCDRRVGCGGSFHISEVKGIEENL